MEFIGFVFKFGLMPAENYGGKEVKEAGRAGIHEVADLRTGGKPQSGASAQPPDRKARTV